MDNSTKHWVIITQWNVAIRINWLTAETYVKKGKILAIKSTNWSDTFQK